MANGEADLSVRSHERVRCALPADLWVAEGSGGYVRLSGSARNAEGAVGATVVDCSAGGMGLSSPVFFPKSCRLRVRISCPAHDGGPPTVMEAMVAVKRVTMADRTPSYYMGVAYEDSRAGAALLALARSAPAAGEPTRA